MESVNVETHIILINNCNNAYVLINCILPLLFIMLCVILVLITANVIKLDVITATNQLFVKSLCRINVTHSADINILVCAYCHYIIVILNKCADATKVLLTTNRMDIVTVMNLTFRSGIQTKLHIVVVDIIKIQICIMLIMQDLFVMRVLWGVNVK